MEGSFTGARWRAGLPPGVYQSVPATVAPVDVRMDVAAFVGLAERGPVCEAVGIDAWSEFVTRFGGTGGGRLLPRAVQLFFANGGRRCVVVRAVAYASVTTASYTLPAVRTTAGDPVAVMARSPGAWGSALRFDVAWRTRALGTATTTDGVSWALVRAAAPPEGTLVRAITRTGTVLAESFATVSTRGDTTFTVDVALPVAALALDIVTVDLTVRLADGALERFADCGPDPRDARFVGAVLAAESSLATLAEAAAGLGWRPWRDGVAADAVLLQGPLEDSVSEPSLAGSDAEADTTRDVFFTTPGDALTAAGLPSTDRPWAANPAPLDALVPWDDTHESEPISLVNLPDLAHPQRRGIRPDVAATTTTRSLQFGVCASDPEVTRAEDPWPELALDDATDLVEVADGQAAIVAWCTAPGRADRVAILDLPPQLDAGAVRAWSRGVASDCAALYAPHLLLVPVEDPTAAPLMVPPGGAVCGAIARRCREGGPAAIPGNLAIAGILDLDRDPLLPEPGFLHESRINLIRPTERGPLLLGTRTTSLDPDWTHLNVRRLLHFLRRQLALDARWAPFEPNDTRLWRRVVRTVERRLRTLQAAGAFAGANPAESWFVRCDASTNPPDAIDRGQLIALVGVAPAVPAEFLVFRLALGADGAVEVDDV